MEAARFDFDGSVEKNGAIHPLYTQGSTFDPVLTFKGPSGTPIDLTGYAGKMQAREKHSTTVVLTFDTADGTMLLGGAAGTIQLLHLPAQTASVTAKDGSSKNVRPLRELVYDLELTPASGRTFKLLYGVLCVAPEVTKT